MSKIEVLVSTMKRDELSFIDEMNLQTNAVIINQHNKIQEETVIRNKNVIKIFSFNERGIGKSRNNALMRAESEICLIADDDMIYVDNYKEKVLKAFEEMPNADMIIFNIESLNPQRPSSQISKTKKITYFNFMKYGACRIAFKKDRVIKNNIFFSLLFGGGAKYGSGEDTLFIYECLKKGLKIYTSKECIAYVKQETSSWYTGINKKLYMDKGALFAAMNKKYKYALVLIFSVKWYKDYKGIFKLNEVIKFMISGAKEYLEHKI